MGRTKALPVKHKNDTSQWPVNDTDFRPRFKRAKRKFGINNFGINVLLPNTAIEDNFLGLLWIGTTNNVFPETCTKCKAQFSKEQETMTLVFDDSVTAVICVSTDTNFLKKIISCKVFAVKFIYVDERVAVKLYLANLPLTNFSNSSGKLIKSVFALVLNISVEDEEDSKKKQTVDAQDLQLLYNNVRELQDASTEPKSSINIRYNNLKPVLRPYQESAVQWMLQREENIEEQEILHPRFQKVVLDSGKEIYFDRYTGYIEAAAPMIKSSTSGGILADEMGLGKTVEVLACILSHRKTFPNDNQLELEKGLVVEKQPKKRKVEATVKNQESEPKEVKKIKVSSKRGDNYIALRKWYEDILQSTSASKMRVEEDEDVVQCICGELFIKGLVECVYCKKMQHSMCLGYTKSLGQYICPQCWMTQPLLESEATLIVCPTALRKQWVDEIRKHVRGDFKLLIYEGSSATPVYPTKLNTYNLVLTTYNVLQADLRLSEQGQPVNLRRLPKYSMPGSPISRVKWWRLCLDEAQTVESAHMVSEMAQRLQACHRWAVTGTPISKDISDLYALIEYLQLTPYSEFETWKHILYNPYLQGNCKPLCDFLTQIMWRSAKQDVIEQINIPKQTIKEHFLEFSAVEKYYYKREHELSSFDFLSQLLTFDLNLPLKTLDRSDLKKVLAPLLSLRMTCTHPNTIRGRYLATKKQVTSMKDLFDALIVKNKNDSEEALRLIISALNGLAGIYLLLQNPVQAVEEYRKVLQLSSRFTEDKTEIHLTVDKLQLVHTMYNLAEVLLSCPPVQPTLRDDTLREECIQLEKKYMDRYASETQAALLESEKLSANVEKLQEKFLLNPGQWYLNLLNWITINDLRENFISRLKSLHETTNVNKMMNSPDEMKLRYVISSWDADISELRITTIDSIKSLFAKSCENDSKLFVTKGIVEKATDCHLRPQKKNKNKTKCPVCVANDNLKQYEHKLFFTVKRDRDDIDMSNLGAWKPSPEELALKALYGLGKARNADTECLQDGKIHLGLLEVCKKEFKEVRRLWTYIHQQICAQDELDICKIRLRLKSPDAEKNSRPSKTENILKQLMYIQENKLDTIHMLDEHELDYQRAVLEGEEKQNMAKLEKCLGTASYLETLRKQQYSGENPDPCPICKTTLQEHWSILPCGHCYCLECIETLLNNVHGDYISCPICRQREKIGEISYVKVGDKCDEQDDMKINGNYSTKIEAVIKLVLTLRNEDPDVKVLVFSTWVHILKLLQSAFEANKIDTTLLSQATVEKALQKFKDASLGVTALLLPIHLGSKGLNLIEATHVVLVEPLLNPGDELQAIGRVHRIGQTKPTVVHKFIVKNTIEESIHRAISSNAEKWDQNKITLLQLRNLFVDDSSNVNTTSSVVLETDPP